MWGLVMNQHGSSWGWSGVGLTARERAMRDTSPKVSMKIMAPIELHQFGLESLDSRGYPIASTLYAEILRSVSGNKNFRLVPIHSTTISASFRASDRLT